MTIGQVIAALLVALLWGLQFVTSKAGVAALPPLLFVTLRFAGVALVLLPFVGRPSKAELAPLALVSVFYGSLCFGLFFAGLHLSQASLAAVLAQLMTPFTILFAWPMLGERPALRTVVGVATAFAGVAIALAGPSMHASIFGAALVAAGAASQSIGNILVRRLAAMPPLRLVGWMATLATPQLLLASLLLEHGQVEAIRHAPPLAWGALAYAVLLGAIVAFALWFRLLGELPLARIAPFALLQTVFGVVSGALLLAEPVTVPLVIGAVVCLAGVALTQIPSRRAAPPNSVLAIGK